MKDGPTWYATNNTATAADAADLAPFGITLRPASSTPVSVERDPVSGRLLAQLGSVRVYRDGQVKITPRLDCPEAGVNVLVQTALDCVERDLHRRDDWHYYRATRTRTGQWSVIISAAIREGGSLFSAHAQMLQPAAHLDEHALSEQLSSVY